MKFLHKAKDGGPLSTVTGYWLVEIKKLFSVVLLKFEDGSRDAYHDHAFNSLNWVLKGKVEERTPGGAARQYEPSLQPVLTTRERMHKVVSRGTTWVLSVRGPWADKWHEYVNGKLTTLTHGRTIVPEGAKKHV